MKFALIALVILSVAILLCLIVMSFKLLRKSQKQESLERKAMKQAMPRNVQRHPKLDEEWKKLEQLKKDLEKKKNNK